MQSKFWSKRLWGWVGRFTLLHVITYVLAGVIFMALQNYADAFATMEQFQRFRPLDSPIVRAAPLFQILRGAFLALILYPVNDAIMTKKYGWLVLFGVLWGLTFLGAVEPVPGSIEGLIYTDLSLAEHLVGAPEVTVQMLAFSWLLYRWEQQVLTKREYLDSGN